MCLKNLSPLYALLAEAHFAIANTRTVNIFVLQRVSANLCSFEHYHQLSLLMNLGLEI